MPKYFDADGVEITEGIFSQEDVDKAITDAVAAKVTADEEAVTAKAAEDEAAAKAGPAPGSVEETLATIQTTLANMTKSNETISSSKFVSDMDEESKTAFEKKYESLAKTGDYEDTPEGLEQRGNDAYQLTTGQTFDHGNFNMNNLSSATGKAPTKPNQEQSEEDKGIGEALGNTEEDYKKHGNKA